MSDDRKKVENAWNELKPSEASAPNEKGTRGPETENPAKRLPPGSYGELNFKDEDSPEGEDQADGSAS